MNLPCSVSANLPETSLFSCHPKQIKIEPNMVGGLEISIKPMRKGIMKSTMRISVKNNPQVYVVHLNARAIPLDFDISPRTILYEKVNISIFCRVPYSVCYCYCF